MSKVKRRSGIAVVQVCQQYNWQPDCVVMVGVGQNHDELLEMHEAWPDIRVVGCEPHPKIAAGLRREWDRDHPEWFVVEAAATEFYGGAILFEKSNHKDGSSLYSHNNHNPRNSYDEIEVDAMTLNSLLTSPAFGVLRPLGDCILLWLDCEGSELQALQGSGDFLKGVQFVNVEMTGIPHGDGWAKPVDVHAFLVDAGFVRTWCHTTRIHNAQYDAIYVRRELVQPELCMCPCGLDRR